MRRVLFDLNYTVVEQLEALDDELFIMCVAHFAAFGNECVLAISHSSRARAALCDLQCVYGPSVTASNSQGSGGTPNSSLPHLAVKRKAQHVLLRLHISRCRAEAGFLASSAV